MRSIENPRRRSIRWPENAGNSSSKLFVKIHLMLSMVQTRVGSTKCQQFFVRTYFRDPPFL